MSKTQIPTGGITDSAVTLGKVDATSTEANNLKQRVCKAWIDLDGGGTAHIDDDFNVASITDNGTGIKAEELSYIFDTRYRASNAIQDKNKHTGLGLAITKKLLELLKSDIKVQSTLGAGSSFYFNLRRVKH